MPDFEKSHLFERIRRSKFRSRFHLDAKDAEYVRKKSMDTIERHAFEMISKNLAPAFIPNDGKQTPMRGHPVFKARHATACCCRECLAKWHGIPPGRELTEDEKLYVLSVITHWIGLEMEKIPEPPRAKAPSPRQPVQLELF